MKKRILYVEDDEDTRNLVKLVLEKEGYDVEVASDGGACFSSISRRMPDLLLLDMMLPDMSGWDIFNKINTERPNGSSGELSGGRRPKVVFLSVIRMSEDRLEKLKEHGITDYIMKPFVNTDLVKRIRTVMD